MFKDRCAFAPILHSTAKFRSNRRTNRDTEYRFIVADRHEKRLFFKWFRSERFTREQSIVRM